MDGPKGARAGAYSAAAAAATIVAATAAVAVIVVATAAVVVVIVVVATVASAAGGAASGAGDKSGGSEGSVSVHWTGRTPAYCIRQVSSALQGTRMPKNYQYSTSITR